MNTRSDFDDKKQIVFNSNEHPLSKFLVAVFEFQIALKMYHFQTLRYSTHKTVDEYSDKLANTIDKFFEVGQGIYGRIYFNDSVSTVQINNVRDKNFHEYIKKFLQEISYVEKVVSKNSDLSNIKDEIKGDLNQLIYLLSLQ